LPTLKYSTAVPVARTVGEVQQMLAVAGAESVAVRYADKRPIGLGFTLSTPHGPRSFLLPVDVEAVHKLLLNQERAGEFKRAARGAYTTPEHAARVAWRVLRDWLAAQLAMIESQMASIDQIMLPYLLTEGEKTLYQLYREREARAIEGGP
jgi:hypothetical protein